MDEFSKDEREASTFECSGVTTRNLQRDTLNDSRVSPACACQLAGEDAVVALHSPKSIRTFCRSILSLDHPHFQFCSRRCTLDLYATQNAADDVTQRLPLDAIGYHSRHLCIFNTFLPGQTQTNSHPIRNAGKLNLTLLD